MININDNELYKENNYKYIFNCLL